MYFYTIYIDAIVIIVVVDIVEFCHEIFHCVSIVPLSFH